MIRCDVRLLKLLFLSIAAAAVLLVAGCASAPKAAPMPTPVVAAPAAPVDGSIYSASGLALFEDQKARRVVTRSPCCWLSAPMQKSRRVPAPARKAR